MAPHAVAALAVGILLLTCGATAPASARPAAVTLLPSGASTVHFVVDVPEPVLAPHPADSTVTNLGLEGYSLEGAPGWPGLPVRVISVAVPPAGEVRVSAQGLGPVVREGVQLAPMPVDAPGLAPGTPVRYPEAYAMAGPTLPQRARLLGVGWLRDQRVARILVEPLDYDPAAQRMTLVRRVDVTVEVEGADAVAEPGDGAFDGALGELLVNPEQGRAWRRARQDLAAAAPATGGMTAARVVPGDTVYARHRWIKIAVTEAGFYKVEFSQLRNLALFGGDATIPLDSLRLFTWPGFPVMPEKTYCDTCGYREVAIRFVESAVNDTLDRNDEYFYFRAVGTSDWSNVYDPTLADTLYIDHPYESRNYYYLTIATAAAPVGGTPRRIATVSGAVSGGATVPATFPERVHYEKDIEYYPNAAPNAAPLSIRRTDLFWEKWFWSTIDVDRHFQPTDPAPDAPGADTLQTFRLRTRVWGVGASDQCKYPGARPPVHLLDVGFNGQALPRLAWSDIPYLFTTRIIDTLMTGLHTRNSIDFSVPRPGGCVGPGERFDRIAVAWVELYYRRRFEAVDNALAFVSEPGGGRWEFHVDSFTTTIPPRVFDVTEPTTPVEITEVQYQPQGATGTYTLAFERDEAAAHRYVILPDTSITRVPSVNVFDPPRPSVDLLDLGSEQQGADAVIIYYDAFKTAADTLAAWRRARLPLDRTGTYDVFTVPVSALYDQFSGGRTDPAALRNFLRAAYYNWSKRPLFVTLLGDASYDFKNLRGLAAPGRPGALIPSYENGFDGILQRQFGSDDWMLNVDNAAVVLPDFFGGRIPAGDAASAMAYVRKLLAYERAAPFGTYRDRVMLVADDDVKGVEPDPLLWTHLRQTANLDALATPPHFDRRYVYLHTYPWRPGWTKPDARKDVFRYVDEGVQIFNFVGHGSAFKISDEGVFVYSDPGSLKNAGRPTVFISASCDVGKFNDPDLQGLGERLVLSPDGGAVGTVSATEEAFSDDNSLLNQAIFNRVFSRDTTSGNGTGQYYVGLSEALLSGKFGSVNSQKYQLMGDAGVRLELPRYWVVCTLWDSAGTVPLTEVKRGQTVTFRGELRGSPKSDAALVAMDGSADLLIEDAQPLDQAPDCRDVPGCLDRPFYYYYAGAMFRGDVSIRGGRFEGRFVAPLEARAGGRARTRAYVQGRVAGAETDGVGSMFTVISPGTGTLADHQGPTIGLRFAGGSSVVRGDALLEIAISDPSGVLTTGHTPQNGIVVTVDDNTATRSDVTPSFRYLPDSYQSGRASFTLPGLAPGPHVITVSAADNLALGLSSGQHRSSAQIAFTVMETPPLSVTRAYLFPNPARSGGPGGGGAFVIDAPGDSINVMMRLYTVSGRAIRTLRAPGGIGQVQLAWDGLDAEGDALANGVYLFRVFVYAREANGESSARQRAIAEGRFVILNR